MGLQGSVTLISAAFQSPRTCVSPGEIREQQRRPECGAWSGFAVAVVAAHRLIFGAAATITSCPLCPMGRRAVKGPTIPRGAAGPALPAGRGQGLCRCALPGPASPRALGAGWVP